LRLAIWPRTAAAGEPWRIIKVIDDWQSAFRDFAGAARDAFLLPGELVLNMMLSHAPALIHGLGVDSDTDPHIVSVVLAVLFWLLVVWALLILFGLLRRVAWYTEAAVHAISFRISLAVHNFHLKLRRALQHITLRRRSTSGSELAEVRFDELDLAVLRSSGRLGPGFATSAPDLAAELSLRPAQVQQSLDKLRKYRMLDIATGSSDGFDNYHVSRSGFLYLKSWLRQAHHT
jgi:hypothetical protein